MATLPQPPTLSKMPTAAGSSPTSPRLASAQRGRTRHVAPAILTMLQQGPCHGYGLMRRLPSLLARPEDRPSASVFYRILKGLHTEGAVRSRVTEGDGAPRRRVYELTAEGVHMLNGWRVLLEADLDTITRVLAAADSRPALGGDLARSGRCDHEIAD